ncbi:MAG: NAD(P)/FAD-dependent oxidoreductase [Chloroflexi bacterium]|nr:NAD(P)/FAD-dependent oxidoreductase [Chloroflexota bacterium]
MAATHTAVLGGGALGLTVALRLAQRGERVTVIEREPLPGGLASGFRVGDAWLEKFYHHLFRSDRAIAGLIDELGLGDRLVWPVPHNPTLYGGKAYRLDSPLSLLRFPPLRLDERVRMGAALAYLRFLPPLGMEGKKAAPWIKRWMGAGPYRVMWEPVLRSKFGALAGDISLPWFWARIHDRSIALGYVRGGFQQVYDRLAERVRSLGGDIRLGTAVERVTRSHDQFEVATSGGCVSAGRVVSTLPPRLTCQIVPELPDWYRERYAWGTAYGAHCLILALDRRLIDGYWMNINDPGYPFMVLVEHTNYMPPSDYGGRHLIYLGNYRPMDDPLMTASKEAVLAEFLPALARINPVFRPEWVTESWMFAAPYAQPIVTPEYPEHIPPFETPVPGLWQASMFQIYPHDRGQNYSVKMANDLAARLIAGGQ